LRELLYVIAVPTTSILGLAAFLTWWSAALYISGMVLGAVFVLRRRERHMWSGAFDDKLSTERVEAARKWLIEE
jgi:hypothetical protein